jgi:glutamine---fructose-6-phosphate transaminase (isomerizing)
MCGIVGANSLRHVTPILVEGLRRLEYRGYDSAGIAVLDGGGELKRCRAKGKVEGLAQALASNPIDGHIGIAHTRWATHGAPGEANAHPHVSNDSLAVVHNGIVENHDVLRKALIEKGYKFTSETDTEVVAHLLHDLCTQGNDIFSAVTKIATQLEGAFALAVISKEEPRRMIAVRQGSPLVIGVGYEENFVASDHIALLPVTQKFIYLQEGDVADVYQDRVLIFDKAGEKVHRPIKELDMTYDAGSKGQYRHYMQKEIFEQVDAIDATLEGRIAGGKLLEGIFSEAAHAIFPKVKKIQITACGTSYHAGLVAKYWIEEIANLSCSIEIASELRYRKAVVQDGTLFICLSQSGETADTLAALRQSKELGYLASLTICNVPESSMVRESDMAFMTRAGVEVGVASTKAFTTQLVALLLLAITLGKAHNSKVISEHDLVTALEALPKKIAEALALDKQIERLSEFFAEKYHTLFLGRGAHFPVALEGALKLKEISYIHAEAYPAGELKHGPLALVDRTMPVVVVAPSDELLEKLKANLEEVRSRGGELIVFADSSTGICAEKGITVFEMPQVDRVIAPIVYTIPLQLLSYHVAVIKGTDVDQPRNLAKSVTVE